MSDNPFSTPREARSITVTLRMTPTEHAAVKAAADAEGKEIVDLIREGLGLVLDRKRAAAPRKERRR